MKSQKCYFVGNIVPEQKEVLPKGEADTALPEEITVGQTGKENKPEIKEISGPKSEIDKIIERIADGGHIC